MKKILPIFVILLSGFQTIYAQEKLPVIKATSLSVDIRDGNDYHRGSWSIAPDAKPDIYTSSNLGKKITFYTDKDSISVLLTKNTKFDFIILLRDSVKAFTQISYKPGYLDLLKAAGTYNRKDVRPVPRFTYQSSADSSLTALRIRFHLDSIAGKGNENSKIINLMHWVHNIIPHDGQHDNPKVKNSLSMIAECKAGNRGLNCRGLGILLNECYLSLGIPSRYITCMPKDSVFDDCHVITMVYSQSDKKWLWMDPTNDAYVMNENGELLSIPEVRERLISGKLLLVNPDANWNHLSSVIKSEYLDRYMAKNLYRLECPMESKFDFETWKVGQKAIFVELLPLEAPIQQPHKSEATNTESGPTFVHYKTNNPDYFWAAPEK